MQKGVDIYDLSQEAPELYKKANIEEKRKLMQIVFKNISLLEGNIIYSYEEPFDILAEAVEATNSSKALNSSKEPEKIFEPSDLRLKTNKNRALDPEIATVLARWYDFRTLLLTR